MGRIIAAGHLNWDVTLRVTALPDPDGEAQITEQHRAGGGSAANVASALAGFGLAAGLIGSVGTDQHGRMATRELRTQGVDTDSVVTVEGETTVKYIVVDEAGEVMVLANDGVNEAIGPEAVEPAMVEGADHVHLTGQRPDTAAALIEVANAAGLTVSFDPGRRIEQRAFEPLLDQVDVLLLNEREATAVFPAASGPPIERAASPDRVIVVKRGADGASVYTGDETHHHPGFAVEAVDTTGAGDAFAAGFLAATVGGESFGRPGSGAEPDYERALAVANGSGALTVQAAGARSAPSRVALAAFLAERTV
ncbi:carbohydrate kinase family protein [Halodesulfurarchaeum formicicum]|uniref:Ribokinase n=1 Tax=Halodesulfurarchaeum formicicum TaxID=1873524 RepID=A0A1J1AF92_9EURY|nr:PfkB family carbohydrate kinase [Halodesulfurarchaeum formicicum]APE96367.1 ribokinase [Halodesulfurarchaeum formicicum]